MTGIERLREYAGKIVLVEEDNAELNSIADQIEAETMPLPRDKHGEVIHVGDKVDGFEQQGAVVEAVSCVEVIARSNVKGGGGYHDGAYPLLLWEACQCELVKPDTIERIKSDSLLHDVAPVWVEELIDRAYECGKEAHDV